MFLPALVIHGGAGNVSATQQEERSAGCHAAIEAGWRVLQGGGSALDAVCEAVVELENCPVFNAGTGSVLTHSGTVEMDASVMEGTQLRAGAAAVIRTFRNPVRLARLILDENKAVFLAGDGAEQFGRAQGLETCAQEDLITPAQLEHWRKRSGLRAQPGHGTVGAVAVDTLGRVAAATSTGGIDGKLPGRIGDSAVIGAGTYANDILGAVSATGSGEAIIRATWARDTAERLRNGTDPAAIAQAAIDHLEHTTGGKGGLIIVDPFGRVGYAFNTPHMTYAWMRADRAAPEIEV